MREAELLTLLTSAPAAFWRFDVDASPVAAAHAARVAQIGGISATFYLDPESELYNANSRSAAAAWNEIVARGHRLGLHVDYRPELGDVSVRQAVRRSTSRATVGMRVLVADRVSFHMPPREVLWRDFPDFDSAYATRWRDCYLSDSRGRSLARTPTNDDQVCLHAEHWFAPSIEEGACT